MQTRARAGAPHDVCAQSAGARPSEGSAQDGAVSEANLANPQKQQGRREERTVPHVGGKISNKKIFFLKTQIS